MSKIKKQKFTLKEFEKLKSALLNQKFRLNPFIPPPPALLYPFPKWSKNLAPLDYAVSLKFLPRALIRTKIAAYFIHLSHPEKRKVGNGKNEINQDRGDSGTRQETR